MFDSGSSGGMAVVPVPKPGNKQSFVTNATNEKKKKIFTDEMTGDEIREIANTILNKKLGRKK